MSLLAPGNCKNPYFYLKSLGFSRVSFLPGDFLSVLSAFSGDSISNFDGVLPDEIFSWVEGSLSLEEPSFVLEDLILVLNSGNFSQSNP